MFQGVNNVNRSTHGKILQNLYSLEEKATHLSTELLFLRISDFLRLSLWDGLSIISDDYASVEFKLSGEYSTWICLFDVWKKFKQYYPKWWIHDESHGTSRTKKQIQLNQLPIFSHIFPIPFACGNSKLLGKCWPTASSLGFGCQHHWWPFFFFAISHKSSSRDLVAQKNVTKNTWGLKTSTKRRWQTSNSSLAILTNGVMGSQKKWPKIDGFHLGFFHPLCMETMLGFACTVRCLETVPTTIFFQMVV